MDTLESIPSRKIRLLGVKDMKPFGKYDYFFVIVKSVDKGDLYYKIKGGNYPKVTKEYIAFTKAYPENQWGWFFRQNFKTEEVLPGIHNIADSLKKIVPSSYFIQHSNGRINLYQNDTLRKVINYGNIVTALKQFDFESLPHKLYKLQRDSIVQISEDPDDLFNEPNGLFFIPAPGFGVLKKIRKDRIYDLIDSVATLSVVLYDLIDSVATLSVVLETLSIQ
ncbi:MAG: hypothetical protein EON98_08215 [Chitinophagaceae bacterium]|nr:MAG: hypothetical protein EON98_08215 [Chitinophagaceae bacterium]